MRSPSFSPFRWEEGLTSAWLLCVTRPVAFEKDTADPFAIDAFLESAKAGAPAKRGLDTSKDGAARKRARDE